MSIPPKTFEPEMRLTCQCSLPVNSDKEACVLYNELKIFLQAISLSATLYGQVTMRLEPCCNEKKERENNEKNTLGVQ